MLHGDSTPQVNRGRERGGGGGWTSFNSVWAIFGYGFLWFFSCFSHKNRVFIGHFGHRYVMIFALFS